MSTHRSTAFLLVLAPLLAGLPGCSGEKEGVLGLPADPPAARTASGGRASRPGTELTPEQGQRLVRQVRANPALMNDLSMKERRFLARAIGAIEQEEEEAELLGQ